MVGQDGPGTDPDMSGEDEFDEGVEEEFEEDGYETEEDGEIEEVEDEQWAANGQPGAAPIRGLEPLPNGRQAGQAGPNSTRALATPPVPEWTALQQLPGATQAAFLELLGELRDCDRKRLTVLLLGKSGVGKSTTANSLFNERVASVSALASDTARPAPLARAAAGFTLTLLDTPGLLEGDAVSDAMLAAVVAEVRGREVDAVLFLDRLDAYRVDSIDVQVIEGITKALGARVWDNTVLGFTHGRTTLPPGLGFEEFVEARAGMVRAAIRKHGGASKGAALPVVVVENSGRCPTNAAGEKVLPSGAPWLPGLMREVKEMALARPPYLYSAAALRAANPNKRRRWLIPLVLAAQIAFKVLVLDRVLEDDGLTGDQYGDYDAAYAASERRRRAEEKAQEQARKEVERLAHRERQREARASPALAAPATPAPALLPQRSAPGEEYEDEDEDDDEEEDDDDNE